MIRSRLTSSARTFLGLSVMQLFRGMDKILPPQLHRALLWPGAAMLARAEMAGTSGASYSLPPALRPAGRAAECRARTNFHLTRLLDFIPDRMNQEKWRESLEIRGLSTPRELDAEDRPIVLATLHFGPLFAMRYRLRAAGYAVTSMIETPLGARNAVKFYKDRLSDQATGMREVPHVISAQGLFQVRDCLKPRQYLMVTVDHDRGKQTEVPLDEAQFRFATGAIRLAARSRARLVPCLIAETSPWHFTVFFGRATPEELLADAPDVDGAARHLLREFMPVLEQYPEQCDEELRGCFQPAAAAVPRAVPAESLS